MNITRLNRNVLVLTKSFAFESRVNVDGETKSL